MSLVHLWISHGAAVVVTTPMLVRRGLTVEFKVSSSSRRWDSWVSDKWLYYSWHINCILAFSSLHLGSHPSLELCVHIIFISCPLHPSPVTVAQRGSGGELARDMHHRWEALSLGNVNLTRGCEQVWLNFAPQRHIIFLILDSKQTHAFLLGDYLPLSRLFTLWTPWKR